MIIFNRKDPACQRAMQRAFDFMQTARGLAAVCQSNPPMPGVYHVPSCSDEAKVYAVGVASIKGREWIHCACKAGRNNMPCTHAIIAEAMHLRIREERKSNGR